MHPVVCHSRININGTVKTTNIETEDELDATVSTLVFGADS
jgi:hypothetical protein